MDMRKQALTRNYFRLGLYILTFMGGIMGYTFVWKPLREKQSLASLEAEARAIYQRRMQKSE